MHTPSLVNDTRGRLARFHGRYPEICKSSGLSYSWLTKFAQGRANNPTMRNLEKLQAVLLELEAADTPQHQA